MVGVVNPQSVYLLWSAFGVWGAGAAGALLTGRKQHHKLYSGVLLTGCLLLLAGLIGCWPANVSWTSDLVYFGLAPLAGRVDPLASVFLALLALSGAAVALFSPGYLAHLGQRLHSGFYWACLFLFMLSMGQVIVSANAINFLVFWEIMSISSVLLVATDHARHSARLSALIYMGATRISTALLVGGFLWLNYLYGSWRFSDWHISSTAAIFPAFVVFLGLCIKAGIWPFHVWLPYAHPEAPAPVSALMSGVMVKVALYAMVRLLVMGGSTSQTLGYAALFLGSVSAVWGVLFALTERDLKRLLAHSTVENVGLILMATALSLVLRAAHLPELAALSLAAALFHAVNHGAFKSLLFLGAGAIDSSTHTRDLSFLGGLARAMPWTMACFFTGAVAICALPPLNGFASKWLLYKTLFHTAFEAATIPERAIALALVGVLALVGALSLACFAKAVGIAFLGKPRSDSAARAREASSGMIAGQVLLAVCCLALGLLVPQALATFAPVLTQTVGEPIMTAGFFTVPQVTVLVAGLALFALARFLVLRSPGPSLKHYVTWDCGYGDLPARTEETGSSFSQPIARIFAPLLQYNVWTEIQGKDKRHFPEVIEVKVFMVPFLERHLYQPAVAALEEMNKALVKVQTGSIHLYLLYVFLTLLVLVSIGVRL